MYIAYLWFAELDYDKGTWTYFKAYNQFDPHFAPFIAGNSFRQVLLVPGTYQDID